MTEHTRWGLLGRTLLAEGLDRQGEHTLAERMRRAQLCVWESKASDAKYLFWQGENYGELMRFVFPEYERLEALSELDSPQKSLITIAPWLLPDLLHYGPFRPWPYTQGASCVYPRSPGFPNCAYPSLPTTDFRAVFLEQEHLVEVTWPFYITKRDFPTLSQEFRDAVLADDWISISLLLEDGDDWAIRKKLAEYPPLVCRFTSEDNVGLIPAIINAYQQFLFMQQPLIDVDSNRLKKKQAKSLSGDRIGVKRDEPVYTVNLRRALPSRMPKLKLPGDEHTSRKGGKWSFEAPIRGHWRHLKSGDKTWVKGHTRGPKGVLKDRVIRVLK